MEEKGFCVLSVEEMRKEAVKFHLETYDWADVVLTGNDPLTEFVIDIQEES